MKRYLAFLGHNYYPCGGMDDFVGDFDSLDDAVTAINTKAALTTSWDDLWARVFDTRSRKNVWSK